MSHGTNGDVEDLLEDKLPHAGERSVEESREAGKDQRQEEKKVQEEKSEILNPDDFISKPFLSKNCTVNEDILVFQYPFLFRLDTLIDYNQIRHCAMLLDLWFIITFISSFSNRLH
jgi:hypothetical protein